MNSSAASRITTARGTGLWFVAAGPRLKGPFTFEELAVELDANRVSPGDFCWRQGFQEWRPVCSVDEFGISRDRPTLLSPYPSVPLPSTGRVGRRSTDRSSANPLSYVSPTRPRIVEEHRVVRLRVQKNSKSTMTWVERIGFFLFAIAFAYVSVWVVASEFEKAFHKKMMIQRLGRSEELGDPWLKEKALNPILVEPIFSAPGYSSSETSFVVQLEGPIEKTGVRFSVGGWRIVGPRSLIDWSTKRLDIDSVYMRRFSVIATGDPTVPGVLRYVFEGEPNIFSDSP